MSSKITLRFVGYFFIFYLTLVLITSLVLIYFAAKLLIGFNAYSHIREADVETIQSHIKEDGEGEGDITFLDPLIQSAEKSGGALQLIDEDGKVITSSMDNEMPSEYTFTDFIKLSNDKKSYIWLLEDGKSLLFTERMESDVLIKNLMATESFPEITDEQKTVLKDHDALFELYDAKGHRIATSNTKRKDTVSGMELFESSQNFAEQKELISAVVLHDGKTAVVRMPNKHYAPFDSAMIYFMKKFLIGFAIFHGILLLFIIGFSIWIGQRFGRPVFYFLKRIEKLSQKDYAYIEDRKLRNLKTGRLKRKYRMYDAVDQSLNSLAENLEENDQRLKKTEQLREDWITGLSHDLKTPLSSIYGYSVMLSSDHEWSIHEVQKFASVMKDKAGYMDELINDLTYTYQLKNNGVLLEKEQIELGQYVKGYSEENGTMVHLGEIGGPVYVSIDPKRFGRVLDNVIGNAVTHNPVNTPIHISIQVEDDSVLLKVRDEGIGMSQEVVENLFDRYYRGTNTTSEDTGTGLGLTIAKQLVEAHSGEIHVQSGRLGTTITIRLPLKKNSRSN
ncbi:sensor histidine kinase [Sporosarcina siberiensis]|uniref:histidine kinase n=1 Tax=Sporosarcina siberiensis TaxID=1365606 RepID=A0ABW4SE15_9BACL